MGFRPFVIDTFDERCRYLFDSLSKKGFKVREYSNCDIDTYEACILVFPPSEKISFADVEKLKRGSCVFGGNAESDAKKFMAKTGIAYFNMLFDETFTVKNTIPTALGCLNIIMEKSNVCINDMDILVIGFGRVAKTLVKYIGGLDGKAYVYSVDEKETALANIFAFKTENSLGNIGKFDAIVNTVPAKLLDSSVCDKIAKGTIVCDLASGDYVDIDALNKKGAVAVKAKALPGKHAPLSAGLYMEECILGTLNNNSGLKAVFLIN